MPPPVRYPSPPVRGHAEVPGKRDWQDRDWPTAEAGTSHIGSSSLTNPRFRDDSTILLTMWSPGSDHSPQIDRTGCDDHTEKQQHPANHPRGAPPEREQLFRMTGKKSEHPAWCAETVAVANAIEAEPKTMKFFLNANQIVHSRSTIVSTPSGRSSKSIKGRSSGNLRYMNRLGYYTVVYHPANHSRNYGFR